MNDLIISGPDEAGWYWFKPTRKCSVSIVYVSDNGLAYLFNKKGETYVLDDLIGFWERAEPEFL